MITRDQLDILRSDWQSNPAWWGPNASGQNDQLVSDDVISDAYNSIMSPSFIVWRSDADTNAISDAIIWANLTPAQANDGSVAFGNRVLISQAKQINIQLLLLGKSTIDATRANIRSGLNDSLTGLPTKSDGTNQSAGWTAVLATLKRQATKLEKLFSSGVGSDASPATVVTSIYGYVLSPSEISASWKS